jgi:hypothetical protein
VASAQWAKGFDFRNTSAYVTDPTNSTYVLAGSTLYPTTRNGVTFGWDSSTSLTSVNRSTSVDARLAGINYIVNNVAAVRTFTVTLPAPGQYSIQLALGDENSGQHIYCTVQDSSTVLLTFNNVVVAGGSFVDATGTTYTAATWPTSETAVTKTFATATLNVVIGDIAGTGINSSTIAHLFVTQLSGSCSNLIALVGAGCK